jgi:hypothetical protein
LPSPEYSARKHHVPTPVAVNAVEAAVAVFPAAGATVTGVPTAFPPLEQPLAPGSGPQTQKPTVPVGVPLVVLPLTVAWSVFETPIVTVVEDGALVVPALAAVTVKHSALLPSEDAV